MTLYDYLIIGGGVTAASAVLGIREVDPDGTIGMISSEGHKPYNRPPLSKKLWQGKPEEGIFRKLPENNMEIFLDSTAISLDPTKKEVLDNSKNVYGYKKLLIATGGRPRRIPGAPEDILYLRTLDDYHIARSWTGKGARIGIIGGGFIGSEIGAALSSIGETVVMVFLEDGIGAQVFPNALSQYITDYYRHKGVDIHPGFDVQTITRNNNQFVLQAKDGQTLLVDHLIAGIGILPNIELAQASGIMIAGPEAGGGILVDDFLRTNQPDVYAAGDVASFNNIALHRQMRVEHEDNANAMGKNAGINMASKESPYHHLPFFYSDLFDLGYEGVGELYSRLDVVEDWKDPFQKGVIYYLKDQKVRGILLWNTWGQIESARQIIMEGHSYKSSDLSGLISG